MAPDDLRRQTDQSGNPTLGGHDGAAAAEGARRCNHAFVTAGKNNNDDDDEKQRRRDKQGGGRRKCVWTEALGAALNHRTSCDKTAAVAAANEKRKNQNTVFKQDETNGAQVETAT